MMQRRSKALQLEFPWRTAEALHIDLEQQTGFRLNLVVTDNSSTIMSVKHERGGGAARVRLHHMFLSAEPVVVQALAAWIRRPSSRRAGGVLDTFIREHSHQIRPRAPRPVGLVTQGERFDLRSISDDVNGAHFQDRVAAGITWGRMPTVRRRRTIRFGSYSPRENVIRIHPLLDQAFVPPWFVRYIVFHEMLHAALGIDETTDGRRRIHSPEFKKIEETYRDYTRAVAWQENMENLNRLLGRKRK